MEIKGLVEDIKKKIDNNEGFNQVCFVACGGSMAALWTAYYMLKSEAKTFGVSIYNSNEFIQVTPATVNEQCLCIMCSLKATRETVKAVEVANGRGAVTIAMTGSRDTPMAKTGQHVVVYSNGDNQIYSLGNQAKALRISFEILSQFEGYDKYPAAIDAYSKIDDIVKSARKIIEPTAIDFAEKNKDEDILYVLASGPLYSSAYAMSCSHLIEMQWKHAIPIHCGEYFHGPFETTGKKLSMVLMMSEGRTRSLDERCLNFLRKYTEKITVLDMREMGINEIDSSVVEFFNPVVMVPIERYVVSKMAEVRNHPMNIRRYMNKVEY